MSGKEDRRGLRARIGQVSRWARGRLPPGVRSLVGILFLLGGLVGFLPVVGFWMIPLGLALIWFDIAALMRRLRHRRGDDR
ncbi:hypothetical protein [Rhodovulum steppense]|uniref:Uncharacterized protein n=1 Tax=Rhodovulum steppense TaxID=540251 RepID=A0A4V2R3J7_9RHOB|nr:hypothetical protein [Rhodovulum steppense]TCM77340.1 hypothetical protein EV216_13021 [Rhodovulum steppense]